jgi:hypothetical protein
MPQFWVIAADATAFRAKRHQSPLQVLAGIAKAAARAIFASLQTRFKFKFSSFGAAF